MLELARIILGVLSDAKDITRSQKNYHKNIHIDFEQNIFWFSTLSLFEDKMISIGSSLKTNLELDEESFICFSVIFRDSHEEILDCVDTFQNYIPQSFFEDDDSSIFNSRVRIKVKSLMELKMMDNLQFVLSNGRDLLDSNFRLTKSDIILLRDNIEAWRIS